MAEALGMVHTWGRGLRQGWWFPVGSKLFLTSWQHQSLELWIRNHNFAIGFVWIWNLVSGIKGEL
jgi:hypothetical protein